VRLTLTRHTRGNPRTCQPDLITAGSDQNVRGRDVFVNQLTLMHMCECRGETDRNPEDTRYLYRSVEQPVERFSSRMPRGQAPVDRCSVTRERLSGLSESSSFRNEYS